MIVWIDGEDLWRMQQKRRELERAFREKHDPDGYNVATFPEVLGADWTWSEVWQAVTAPPFLTAFRFVSVDDAYRVMNDDDEQLCARLFPQVPDTTVFVVVGTQSRPAKKTRKISPVKTQLEELGDTVRRYTFPLLTEKEAVSWIQSEALRFDRVMGPQAARCLTERVGPNSALLAQEVRKVATSSQQQEISREWIETLVRPRSESQMFGFIEAFSSESPKRCLELLEKERSAGTDDGLLFSLLVRQIRILLQARSLHEYGAPQDIWRKTLGIPPFVLTKLQREVQRYSLSQLLGWHETAQQIDLAMKRGRYRPQDAVDVLVGHLLQQKTTGR